MVWHMERAKKNPYIVDRPIGEHDLFFNREDIFAWIEDRLRAGERTLVVFGPRRIGKTSLLLQLPVHFFALYAPVVVSFAPRERDSAQDLLKRVVTQVERVVKSRWGVAVSDLSMLREAESSMADTVLPALVEALGDRRLLICCDEMETTHLSDPIVREAIQELLALTDDGLRLLFCVEGSPGRELLTDALASTSVMEIGYLSESEAEDLLIRPALNRLAYDYNAVRQVHQFTSGQPYFTQLFGYLLYEQRAIAGWVSIYDVMATAAQVVDLGQEEFQRIWEVCTPDAKMALAAFGALKGRQGVATVDDLYNVLRREHIHILPEEIEKSLEKLVAAGILRRLGSSTYRFGMELFWLWLRDHKEVTRVAREVRRYRRKVTERVIIPRPRRINLGAVFFWLVAAALVVMVAVTWRSRDTRVVSGPSVEGTQTATRIVVVTPEPTLTPTVSLIPMRSYIAYMAKENPADTWEIWIMRSDGSDPQRLTSNDANDTVPAWSPDGRKVLFESDRDGNGEIYVMNSDGNKQVNLTNHPAEDGTPSWSPDGSMIAFSSYRDGNWEIYLMERDGSNPVRLTYDDASDYAPVWSPDGSRIVFVSKRDGNWEIYVMKADGADPLRLTEEEATDFAPVWSPDGSMIAFESYRDGNMEIYIMREDGSDLMNLTEAPRSSDHGPTWSPDGSHIAYYSNQDGGWDVVVTAMDGSGVTNLTLSQATEQTPAWQPWLPGGR